MKKFILICFILTTALGFSQEKKNPPLNRILLIFDASQSMHGKWIVNKKIVTAKEILITIVDTLETIPNLQMALRMYGHQSPVPPQNCNDTKLEVPFGNDNAGKIRQKLRYVIPKGTTPLANSIGKAAGDFPPCDNCRNLILLITDGVEACDQNPCEVSERLQGKGIVLKPFVVGIGIDHDLIPKLDCIGTYYNAAKEEDLKKVLALIVNQALNKTTLQINLLDAAGKPLESNVNMTFMDKKNGQVKYNFMHTLNRSGKPDTLEVDHLVKYKVKVNTIPPVYIDNVSLKPGEHNVYTAKTPQGSLIISEPAGSAHKNLRYLVRQAGKKETLQFKEMGKRDRYIVGKYDIELPTLPITRFKGVEIKQSETTKLEVASPGLVQLRKTVTGYGSIYILRKGKQEWVCNTNSFVKNESIRLQPGNYKIIYRPKHAKETRFTIEKSFTVKQSTSQLINL